MYSPLHGEMIRCASAECVGKSSRSFVQTETNRSVSALGFTLGYEKMGSLPKQRVKLPIQVVRLLRTLS